MHAASALPAMPDARWSSTGLGRRDAILAWQDWAAQTIAPIDVSVRDTASFAAGWRSYGLGDLRLLLLTAPAQRVVHRGTGSSGRAAPSIQLVYARRGALKTRIGAAPFTLAPGEFVLLDNMRFYQMDMDDAHEALDLMMPRAWIERWVDDIDALLARPVSTRGGWAAPLGGLLEVMAGHIDESPEVRPLLADRIGALLTLIAQPREPGDRRGMAAAAVLRRIERDCTDPDLSLRSVARALGMSTRRLQALLAARGTSFVQHLTATRLDRADALLRISPARVPIGEIAFRCGFLDPGYFARQFRRRFGMSPRERRPRN